VKNALATVRRLNWLLFPALLFIAMAGWSISSPPGSSPDEDFHLVSAWCAHGVRDGFCEPGSTAITRVVPLDLIKAPCYAFHPTMAGDCPLGDGQSVETDRGNFTGYYPNGFYAFMGLFASPSLEGSVLVMRLANAAIYAAGLGALLFLARPGQRQNYMLGALVPMVPLGVFTVASINPSSWALTSATLVWASVVEFIRATERPRRISLGMLALVAIFLGMASRADGAAYAALAIGLAWLATAHISRRTVITGAVAAVISLAALLWSLSFGSAAVLTSIAPMNPTQPRGGWLQRLQDLPGFYAGAFGSRGLGWLDTSTRSATWVLAGAAFVAVVFWGVRRCGWRKAASLLLIATVAASLPIMIATLRYATLQESLQPRYFLPLLVIAAMIAVSENNEDGPRLHPAQALLLAASLGIAHANALHTNLRRYLTGIDKKWFNLNTNVEWWWSWAPAPMLVFGVAAGSYAIAAVLAALDLEARTPTDIELRGQRFVEE